MLPGVLAVVGLLCCCNLQAQNTKLRKAADLMMALQYNKAINIYTRIQQRNPDMVEPAIGLAKAYRKLGDLAQAEQWYAYALQLENVDASAYYAYGQLLLQKGDCYNAQSVFRAFLQRKPYDERRHQLNNVCSYREMLLSKGEQGTSLYHPGFNDVGSELGAAFWQDGIVFGASRLDKKRQTFFYDLYYAPVENPTSVLADGPSFGEALPFSTSINGDLNEAIVTFSPNGQELYFTRNQPEAYSEKNPLHLLEIMVASKGGGDSWSSPKSLTINNPSYSNAHPALSPDGQRLFFTSDRPGGFGGKDIYFCERLGQNWSMPINLGPRINTEGDELFPFYHEDGELYFASDGHLGLGGQDIFRSEDLGGGIWGQATNLGAPVNSTADDFGLILKSNGSQGYFTSNREGGVGNDDIYAFTPRQVWTEIHFNDVQGHPVKEVVEFQLKNEGDSKFTNSDGVWGQWLAFDECIYATLLEAGYLPETKEICGANSALTDTLRINWTLMPKQRLAHRVLGEGDKMLTVYVYNEMSGRPVKDAQIAIQSDRPYRINKLHTRYDGSFKYPIEEGECLRVTIAKDGFFTLPIANPFCSDYVSPGERFEVYLAPYRLEDEDVFTASSTTDLQARGDFVHSTNLYKDEGKSIPYLLNVYYDLGRASVRPEAFSELHRLFELMRNNPELTIEIGSHTDAQGSDSFNMRLSQRRANAICRWLVKRGVAKNRIIAKGYGESRLVNGCDDSSNCTDKDHQANRRTEFRVVEHALGHSN